MAAKVRSPPPGPGALARYVGPIHLHHTVGFGIVACRELVLALAIYTVLKKKLKTRVIFLIDDVPKWILNKNGQ